MDKLLSGRHILVVEDEMLVLMITKDFLDDLGCTSISSAATVAKALALIGAERFDAVVLDMNLNGDTTTAVADALIADGVPFVFATGYGGGIRNSDSGRPVLTKPYGLSDMERVLERLLPRQPLAA